MLADTERVDRGLPPAVGLVAEFDQDAQAAAQADTDPTPTIVPPGIGIVRWASNWSENAGALGSNYNWMYDDGPGSGNLACGERLGRVLGPSRQHPGLQRRRSWPRRAARSSWAPARRRRRRRSRG